jgi:hypothetical protein
MATIVAGLGAVLHANRGAIPVQDVKDVLSTVERCLALDRLLPSFGNVVTIAGLQVSLSTSRRWGSRVDSFYDFQTLLQLQFLGHGSKSEVYLAATR